jgi:hypothetical protein
MLVVTVSAQPTAPAACAALACARQFLIWSIPMLDAVMMAIAFAFFALSIAYVYACDRL